MSVPLLRNSSFCCFLLNTWPFSMGMQRGGRNWLGRGGAGGEQQEAGLGAQGWALESWQCHWKTPISPGGNFLVLLSKAGLDWAAHPWNTTEVSLGQAGIQAGIQMDSDPAAFPVSISDTSAEQH